MASPPHTALTIIPSLPYVLSLFLGTFILEDAAAIGGGLLLAANVITWPSALFACFLGIWLGDAGLYALSRYGGRSWFERSRFRLLAPRVAGGEAWFKERGNWILVFSRAIPGARLPTYLAAGFLRIPLPHFLLITAAASFAWALLVLFVTKVFGAQVFDWLISFKKVAVVVLPACATGWLLRGRVRKFAYGE